MSEAMGRKEGDEGTLKQQEHEAEAGVGIITTVGASVIVVQEEEGETTTETTSSSPTTMGKEGEGEGREKRTSDITKYILDSSDDDADDDVEENTTIQSSRGRGGEGKTTTMMILRSHGGNTSVDELKFQKKKFEMDQLVSHLETFGTTTVTTAGAKEEKEAAKEEATEEAATEEEEEDQQHSNCVANRLRKAHSSKSVGVNVEEDEKMMNKKMRSTSNSPPRRMMRPASPSPPRLLHRPRTAAAGGRSTSGAPGDGMDPSSIRSRSRSPPPSLRSRSRSPPPSTIRSRSTTVGSSLDDLPSFHGDYHYGNHVLPPITNFSRHKEPMPSASSSSSTMIPTSSSSSVPIGAIAAGGRALGDIPSWANTTSTTTTNDTAAHDNTQPPLPQGGLARLPPPPDDDNITNDFLVAAEIVPSELDFEERVAKEIEGQIQVRVQNALQRSSVKRRVAAEILRDAVLADLVIPIDEDDHHGGGGGDDTTLNTTNTNHHNNHGSDNGNRVRMRNDNNNGNDNDASENNPKFRKNWFILTTILLLMLVAAAGIVVAWILVNNDDEDTDDFLPPETLLNPYYNNTTPTISPTTTNTLDQQQQQVIHESTMEEIKTRGYIRCGVEDYAIGFSFLNGASKQLEGFNIDLCRAIAAAVLGDPNKVETVLVPFVDWNQMLQNRTVDLLSILITFTMGRDVWETYTSTGYTFSVPYGYTGLAFAGDPTFVDCADSLDAFTGLCRDLKVCVLKDSTYELILQERFPEPEKVSIRVPRDGVEMLESGECNVVSGDTMTMAESLFRDLGYTGPYKLGSKMFSKEPVVLATRDNDAEWSNLVNLAVNALYSAEAQGITQTTAETDLAGSKVIPNSAATDFRAMLISMIASVGNMEEIWNRTLDGIFPRQGLNSLNTNGETGLISSLPFGDLEMHGYPLEGGVIETITRRGFLRCGVTRRAGLADYSDGAWTGLDIEFCRAIAAAIFRRDTKNSVEYVEIDDTSTRFVLLASGDFDVLAGERVNLLNSWREPTTDAAYTYSIPYFYNTTGESYAFATRQDDNQWSDFVYWVVMASFYAEEQGISHGSPTGMPLVHLFGEGLKQMLRDSVYESGSYADMYNRTMEAVLPRSGRNQLNTEGGPQQFAFPFV